MVSICKTLHSHCCELLHCLPLFVRGKKTISTMPQGQHLKVIHGDCALACIWLVTVVRRRVSGLGCGSPFILHHEDKDKAERKKWDVLKPSRRLPSTIGGQDLNLLWGLKWRRDDCCSESGREYTVCVYVMWMHEFSYRSCVSGDQL